MNWHKLSEEQPKEKGDYLLYTKIESWHDCTVAKIRDDFDLRYWPPIWQYSQNVTHWLKIEGPTKEAKQ